MAYPFSPHEAANGDTPRVAGDAIYLQLQRLINLGCHLMPLVPGDKAAASKGWPDAQPLGIEEARMHLDAGRNLGINLGRSGMVCLDAEDALATQALIEAGFTPDAVTAKSQLTPDDPQFAEWGHKAGGAHVWLWVDEGVDPATLTSKTGIKLPGGGMLDVLAGRHYAVAPLSRIAESPHPYAAAPGGVADVGVAAPVRLAAPAWLFDSALAAPPSLVGTAGVAVKAPEVERTWESVEAQAESQSLSDAIDRIGWDEWAIDGDSRLTWNGERDTCGCMVLKWHTADNSKSVTLHDDCTQGNAAHIWSGTMQTELGLVADHLSRLDLSAAMLGVSRPEAAREVGITLGGAREYTAIEAGDLLEAAEAAGDEVTAARLRKAAEGMRVEAAARRQRMLDSGKYEEQPSPPEYRVDGLLNFAPPVIPTVPAPAPAPVPAPAPAPAPPASAPARVGWRAEAAPIEARIFAMTPGLRHVAATADALGAGRQGVLAVTLARVAAALEPTVRLVTATGHQGGARQGGSLNFYSSLVGRPHMGKTVTLDAGEHLVPLSADDLIPEGTAEGIIKGYGFMRKEKVGKGEDAYYTYSYEEMATRQLMIADEIDGVAAEMSRQGTKLGPVWRSMWMGTMVGTTTGTLESRTRLQPHSYRLAALLGCQPAAAWPIFAEGGRGTPQRFYWAPCTRGSKSGKLPPGPLPLAYMPAPTPVGVPDGYIPTLEPPKPKWIEWPPAARAFIETELAALDAGDPDPYGELEGDADEDPMNAMMGHETFLRLKIMALLAIMDGLEQPTDVHWEAAGLAMTLREMSMRRTAAMAKKAGKDAAVARGLDQGVTRSAARRGEADADREFQIGLASRIVTVIGRLEADRVAATEPAIRRQCSKRQQSHVPAALAAMAGAALTLSPAGVYRLAA